METYKIFKELQGYFITKTNKNMEQHVTSPLLAEQRPHSLALVIQHACFCLAVAVVIFT